MGYDATKQGLNTTRSHPTIYVPTCSSSNPSDMPVSKDISKI